ncbi:MAG: c-type cytochrome [Bryobacterales bacterium]|nr:c-type cytochrome [Bryobacterales bacterium]
MRNSVFTIGAALALCLGQAAWAAGEDKVARGKYLAEEIGKCQECHTPVNDKGELDLEKNMKGRVMNWTPITPVADWHKTSPDITPAGRLWTRWGGEEAMIKYLMTGLTPRNKPAGPPMPAYKMKREDAEAIVEYLKTLK